MGLCSDDQVSRVGLGRCCGGWLGAWWESGSRVAGEESEGVADLWRRGYGIDCSRWVGES